MALNDLSADFGDSPRPLASADVFAEGDDDSRVIERWSLAASSLIA